MGDPPIIFASPPPTISLINPLQFAFCFVCSSETIFFMITKISFWENPMVSFQSPLVFLPYLPHLALLEIRHKLKRG